MSEEVKYFRVFAPDGKPFKIVSTKDVALLLDDASYTPIAAVRDNRDFMSPYHQAEALMRYLRINGESVIWEVHPAEDELADLTDRTDDLLN
jgi:hypothetical protein